METEADVNNSLYFEVLLAVAVSANGDVIAVGGSRMGRDATQIQLLRSADYACLAALEASHAVHSLEFLGAHFIVAGDSEGALSLFRLPTSWGEAKNPNLLLPPLYRAHAHQGPVHEIAVDPTGTVIATAGEDGYLRTYRLSLADEPPRLQWAGEIRLTRTPLRALAISRSAAWVAVAGDDDELYCCRLGDLNQHSVHVLRKSETDNGYPGIRSLIFSADDQIAVGSGDGRVGLWQIEKTALRCRSQRSVAETAIVSLALPPAHYREQSDSPHEEADGFDILNAITRRGEIRFVRLDRKRGIIADGEEFYGHSTTQEAGRDRISIVGMVALPGQRIAVIDSAAALRIYAIDRRRGVAECLRLLPSRFDYLADLLRFRSTHDNRLLRRKVLRELNIQPETRARTLIEECLSEECDSQVRAYAAECLGDRGSKESQPALVEALGDRDRSVREAAFHALLELDSTRAFEAALTSRRADIRVSALLALPSADEPTIRLLNLARPYFEDSSGEVWAAAIWSVYQLEAKASAEQELSVSGNERPGNRSGIFSGVHPAVDKGDLLHSSDERKDRVSSVAGRGIALARRLLAHQRARRRGLRWSAAPALGGASAAAIMGGSRIASAATGAAVTTIDSPAAEAYDDFSPIPEEAFLRDEPIPDSAYLNDGAEDEIPEHAFPDDDVATLRDVEAGDFSDPQAVSGQQAPAEVADPAALSSAEAKAGSATASKPPIGEVSGIGKAGHGAGSIAESLSAPLVTGGAASAAAASSTLAAGAGVAAVAAAAAAAGYGAAALGGKGSNADADDYGIGGASGADPQIAARSEDGAVETGILPTEPGSGTKNAGGTGETGGGALDPPQTVPGEDDPGLDPLGESGAIGDGDPLYIPDDLPEFSDSPDLPEFSDLPDLPEDEALEDAAAMHGDDSGSGILDALARMMKDFTAKIAKKIFGISDDDSGETSEDDQADGEASTDESPALKSDNQSLKTDEKPASESPPTDMASEEAMTVGFTDRFDTWLAYDTNDGGARLDYLSTLACDDPIRHFELRSALHHSGVCGASDLSSVSEQEFLSYLARSPEAGWLQRGPDDGLAPLGSTMPNRTMPNRPIRSGSPDGPRPSRAAGSIPVATNLGVYVGIKSSKMRLELLPAGRWTLAGATREEQGSTGIQKERGTWTEGSPGRFVLTRPGPNKGYDLRLLTSSQSAVQGPGRWLQLTIGKEDHLLKRQS